MWADVCKAPRRRPLPDPGEAECDEYAVAYEDVFLTWEQRDKPSKDAIHRAEGWLDAAKKFGPDTIPHTRHVVRGREERTSIFQDVGLIITYRVMESPPCTIGIVDVSSISERGG